MFSGTKLIDFLIWKKNKHGNFFKAQTIITDTEECDKKGIFCFLKMVIFISKLNSILKYNNRLTQKI